MAASGPGPRGAAREAALSTPVPPGPPDPATPGRRARLTIVPAAEAAAAARAPAVWRCEEKEGQAGGGECGARRECGPRGGGGSGGCGAGGAVTWARPGPALPPAGPPHPPRVLGLTPRARRAPAGCASAVGAAGLGGEVSNPGAPSVRSSRLPGGRFHPASRDKAAAPGVGRV
ncbi:unnamed protein product [Rangifer tarandus platyrhynchus]|uniref:Uncharacterized protein n=2 Tax=Rangifer tarandus platyrhynchus TaxID=3082113 RepID=A0ABN8Y992_RANTA|nr:unnamed protein product [Rangifer tarandus platyrhynchus]CAI9696308.1 unnamed protein product [Rangifer tarandus platyrhynchus]